MYLVRCVSLVVLQVQSQHRVSAVVGRVMSPGIELFKIATYPGNLDADVDRTIEPLISFRMYACGVIVS